MRDKHETQGDEKRGSLTNPKIFFSFKTKFFKGPFQKKKIIIIQGE